MGTVIILNVYLIAFLSHNRKKTDLTFDLEKNSSFLEKIEALPGQRSNQFFHDYDTTNDDSHMNFFFNNIYFLSRIFLAHLLEYGMHSLVAIGKNKIFNGKGHKIVKNRRINMPFFPKMV